MTVEVPDRLAGELLALVLAGIRETVRRNGGTVSADCRRLLADLHTAGMSGNRPASGSSGHSRKTRAVTAEEAAGRRGVTADHVRRLCRTGRLPAHRSGGTWLIEVEVDERD